jgi:O-antigen ligase
MSTHAAYVPLVFTIGTALFAWFYRLAAMQRHVVMVTFILGLLVVEGTLYETIVVPVGIFHPAMGSLQVRTIDIVIILALVASALAGPRSQLLTRTKLLWFVFALWIVTEALVGFMEGNSATFIGYEVKTILYLGLFTVASRIPLRDPRTRRSLERFFIFTAGVAAFTITLGAAGGRMNVNLPGLHGAEIGKVGSISATLFVSIGALVLAIAMTSEVGRLKLLFCAPPLLIPPLMAHQRASLLNLLVCVVAIVALLPLARHRLRATPVEVALVFLAALAFISLPVLIEGVVAEKRVIPFSSSLSTAISGGEKRLSAQDRVNQLVEARKLIAERPLLGHGLGQTIEYYEVGFKEFQSSYLTHNIVTDLLLRTGIVGLLFFVLALGASLGQAVQTWRFSSEPLIAGVALGCCAIIAGWVAHGLVESLFEHVQLMPLFGICIGLAQRAAAEASEPRTELLPDAEPRLVPLPG